MFSEQLKRQPYAPVNLEVEAQKWLKGRGLSNRKNLVARGNPLLNPDICQTMVDDLHRRLNIAWSYGGWMENRPTLWKGSYLQADRKYLHLGLDVNLPEGVEVDSPWEAEVLRVDHDEDLEGGWGGRVVLQPKAERWRDNVYLLAHLSDQLRLKVGDVLAKGELIGAVGKPEVNGGWFSHLHIQAIEREYYAQLSEKNLADLDGYARLSSLSRLSIKFPDPSPLLFMK